VRDSKGLIVAAVNVTVNASETSIATLKGEHLPKLLATARAITDDFERMGSLPVSPPLVR
jgi:IclR family pca regulon transcriptional regulator